MMSTLMQENWTLPLSWLGAKRHKTSLGDRKNLSSHLSEQKTAWAENAELLKEVIDVVQEETT